MVYIIFYKINYRGNSVGRAIPFSVVSFRGGAGSKQIKGLSLIAYPFYSVNFPPSFHPAVRYTGGAEYILCFFHFYKGVVVEMKLLLVVRPTHFEGFVDRSCMLLYMKVQTKWCNVAHMRHISNSRNV